MIFINNFASHLYTTDLQNTAEHNWPAAGANCCCSLLLPTLQHASRSDTQKYCHANVVYILLPLFLFARDIKRNPGPTLKSLPQLNITGIINCMRLVGLKKMIIFTKNNNSSEKGKNGVGIFSCNERDYKTNKNVVTTKCDVLPEQYRLRYRENKFKNGESYDEHLLLFY